jgi:hypothetical protein
MQPRVFRPEDPRVVPTRVDDHDPFTTPHHSSAGGGVGGAGHRAAIAALGAGFDCLVVSKRSVRALSMSNSRA